MTLLWRCLRHPRMFLYAVDARQVVRHEVERRAWTGLLVLALAGTLLYGLSMGRAAALLGAASAAWALFGAALLSLSGRSAATCAHACLVSMVYGVGVLAAGAGLNLLLRPGLLQNVACVAVSNALMAGALAAQMAVVGVSAWKTFAAWTVVLDGAGLALFWLLGGLA
jgi:hypothetical protein